MPALDYLPRVTAISDFNHGKAAQSFARVEENKPLFVLKHNKPVYTVLTVEDYAKVKETEENYKLLLTALDRMRAFKEDEAVPSEELYAECGIDLDSLDNTDEVEFE